MPNRPDASGAVLYLRLSKDDDRQGESFSISNQRKFLLRYAAEHGFAVTGEYVDDGYSGTTFRRPAFQQMIADIESGKIHLILTKDLSRLGRDYIKTGEFTEHYFPSRRVRFIAVSDGYDSDSSSTDLIPFRNLMNEMYARDISRKIRASLLVRMEEGSFIGSRPPYGYQAVRRNINGTRLRTLHIHPETAPTVQYLFESAASGIRPSVLAAELNQGGFASPGGAQWTANTIIKILHNPVYLGHLVQGKTKKLSFKSTLSLSVPEKDRIHVFHTHPPLVSEELFYRCREQLTNRICKKR